MLNYNRRLAFWIQIEALKLAVKSMKISENPSDLADENAKKLERFGTQHQADLLCVFDIFKELEEFREIHAFIVHYEKD